VLDNLFSNSRKHKVKNIVVGVLEASGSKLKLSVKDDSVGVPRKNAKKIFEMGLSTTNGSGLGLYHVTEMIRGMNGDIELNAENERSGIHPHFWKMKLNYNILWIDDTPKRVESIQPALKEHFDELGYRLNITLEKNWANVVEAIKNPELDLIIVDFQLPRVTGKDLIETIRKSTF
jgi:signal transduction histidine kinase